MIPNRILCNEKKNRGKLVLVVHSAQMHYTYEDHPNNEHPPSADHRDELEFKQQMDQHNRSHYVQDYIVLVLAFLSAMILCFYKRYYKRKHKVRSISGWIQFDEMPAQLAEYKKFIQIYKSTVYDKYDDLLNVENCKAVAANNKTRLLIYNPGTVMDIFESHFGKGVRLEGDRFLRDDGERDMKGYEKFKSRFGLKEKELYDAFQEDSKIINSEEVSAKKTAFEREAFPSYEYLKDSSGAMIVGDAARFCDRTTFLNALLATDASWDVIKRYYQELITETMEHFDSNKDDTIRNDVAIRDMVEAEITKVVQDHLEGLSDLYLDMRKDFLEKQYGLNFWDTYIDAMPLIDGAMTKAHLKESGGIIIPDFETQWNSGLLAMSQTGSLEARRYNDLSNACLIVPVSILVFGFVLALICNYSCCHYHFFNPWSPLLKCLAIIEGGSEKKIKKDKI